MVRELAANTVEASFLVVTLGPAGTSMSRAAEAGTRLIVVTQAGDEMAGAAGGAVERSPWPPQDESDTAGADWLPILTMRELMAIWRMTARFSGRDSREPRSMATGSVP
jgi:hypothetical protein